MAVHLTGRLRIPAYGTEHSNCTDWLNAETGLL